MDVPEDFEARFPTSFERHVGRSRSGGDDEPPDGVWVAVEGGGIPFPLIVRIDQAHDGRFVITGMLIGRSEHREITWSDLRQVKPASIVNMLFAGWDPRQPSKMSRELLLGPHWWAGPITAEEREKAARGEDLDPRVLPAGSPEAEAEATWHRDWQRVLVAEEIWRETGGETPDRSAVEEVTRPRASVATNLTAFADVYKRHFATNPRRATTSTAEELNISRATAIRRLAECRDLDLIPSKEQRP